MRWWVVLPVTLFYRRWVWLALPAGLMAAVLLTSSVGAWRPAQPTGLETADCWQPCWQGFRPGDTGLDELLDMARNSPLTAPGTLDMHPAAARDQAVYVWTTWQWPVYEVQAHLRADRLMRLVLNSGGPLRLGDALLVLGTPSHAMLCPRVALNVNARRAVSATLYFYGGAVELWAISPWANVWRITPEMQVYQVTYRTPPPDAETWVPLGVSRWQGLGRANYDAFCR